MDVLVTRHARKRLKERNGFPKSAIERMAQKAFDEGYRHYETRGVLHKWISKVFLKHEIGNEMRVYGDVLYIFHEHKLITVFPIPSEIKLHLKSYLRKGERHSKKGGYIPQ